jgi:radical SAM superfamily enzyme YgiQ (UPF0313 family)
MRILLVSPPYAALRGLVPIPATHLGLLYLSSSLNENGFETQVLVGDTMADVTPTFFVSMKSYTEKWDDYRKNIEDDCDNVVWSRIEKTVREFNPSIVGITATTPIVHSAAKVASIVRRVNPEISIVMGGAHATLCTDAALDDKNIDFVIRGEGEKAMTALATELSKDSPGLDRVSGLSYRSSTGQLTHNPAVKNVADLDELPLPARETVLGLKENNPIEHSMIASRGCSYRCAFCADRRLWGKVRFRSASCVVDELEKLVEDFPTAREVYFNDGTMTAKKKFFYDLCEGIVERGIGLDLFCTARFDNLNQEMADQMMRTGFKGLYLGAESGDSDILKRMRKNTNAAEIEEKTHMLRQTGIQSMVSILVGVPGESAKSLNSTMSLMKRIEADMFDVNCFVPLPGSDWYEEMSPVRRGEIDWLKSCYKGGYPYLFEKENKTELNKYVDEIYQIADDRLRETMARAGQ